MTADENDDAAIPYFQGIAQAMSHYQIGVYGTRNTCTMVSKAVAAVKYAYVSNMSTGYSGNLGFSQPLNWAFDKFDETGVQGNLPGRDKVGVSHADEGVTRLVAPRVAENWIEQSDWTVMKQLLGKYSIELNGEPHILVNEPSMKVSVSYKNVTTLNPDSVMSFSYPIKNGKIDLGISAALYAGGFHLGSNLNQLFDEFTLGLDSGYVTINVEKEKNAAYETAISIEFSDKELKKQSDDITNEDVVVLDIEFNWDKMKEQLTEVALETASGLIKSELQGVLPLLENPVSLIGRAMFAFVSGVVTIIDDIGQLPDNNLLIAEVVKAGVVASSFVLVLVVTDMFGAVA